MAFGPKAQPFAQRRRAPGVAGSALENRIPHKKFLFAPAARPFLRNGRAAGAKRKKAWGRTYTRAAPFAGRIAGPSARRA
jgi:hypothetical protein